VSKISQLMQHLHAVAGGSFCIDSFWHNISVEKADILNTTCKNHLSYAQSLLDTFSVTSQYMGKLPTCCGLVTDTTNFLDMSRYG